MVLGCVCILAGSLIALYAGWIALLLVREPQGIAIISYLTDLGTQKLHAARGSIGDHGFTLELGEPVYWLIVLLIGVLLLGIVASVAKALISVGIALLRPVFAESRDVRAAVHDEPKLPPA
jgi:hypothetical protein